MPRRRPGVGYLDLPLEWERFQNAHRDRYASTTTMRRGFLTHVRNEHLNEYARGEESWIKFCRECGQAGIYNSMYLVGRNRICAPCTGRLYRYCTPCEAYYKNTTGNNIRHEHRAGAPSCCVSEQTSFTVRNGEGTLRNNTKIGVSLAAGEISDEGMVEIQSRLQIDARNVYYNITAGLDWADRRCTDASNAYSERVVSIERVLQAVGTTWQTKQGNFTKRLSRALHKDGTGSLTPEQMTAVGNIASAHSQGVEYRLEVTRDLNKSASYFGHSGSCWWSSYSASRCLLKTTGGFGMVSFNENNRTSGRAWVMPLKERPGASQQHHRLAPTYETQSPAAYVIFNGYGQLSGYSAARVLAQMTGMTYRKVRLQFSEMYINSEAGYLVAPEALAEQFTDGRLYLEGERHNTRMFANEQAEAERAALTAQTATALADAAAASNGFAAAIHDNYTVNTTADGVYTPRLYTNGNIF